MHFTPSIFPLNWAFTVQLIRIFAKHLIPCEIVCKRAISIQKFEIFSSLLSRGSLCFEQFEKCYHSSWAFGTKLSVFEFGEFFPNFFNCAQKQDCTLSTGSSKPWIKITTAYIQTLAGTRQRWQNMRKTEWWTGRRRWSGAFKVWNIWSWKRSWHQQLFHAVLPINSWEGRRWRDSQVCFPHFCPNTQKGIFEVFLKIRKIPKIH